MVLLGDLGWDALAVIATVRAAGTVSPAAPHQKTAGPEDGVCPLQLLAQGDGEVPRGAAVQLHFLSEKVKVYSWNRKCIQQTGRNSVGPRLRITGGV